MFKYTMVEHKFIIVWLIYKIKRIPYYHFIRYLTHGKFNDILRKTKNFN